MVVAMIKTLFAVAIVCAPGLAACSDRDVTSMENGLWQMFSGHDKPIILKKPPPPVYCYDTIGEPDCYDRPQQLED